MKFCDKLIKLRKRTGLSQEELGEKLNVTRQTVSKWELGQSKPETDKLLEISKLFNIDFNVLIDDNTKIENDMIVSHFSNDDLKPRKWLLVLLIIVAIIIVIILGNKFITIISNQSNNSLFDKINDDNNFDENFNNLKDNINKEIFNQKFLTNIGKVNGSSVSELFDKVINNNKTNTDYVISIKYNELTTSDYNEIENIKKDLKLNDDYDITAEYDENGYINAFSIKKEKNSNDAKFFNFFYEAHNGTNNGIVIKNILDNVVTNNNTNEDHIIVIIYNSTNTSNVDEIRNLKRSISDWTEYEVILDYDEYGYINQITIEN